MMSPSPLVSILMTAYNREKFIEEAIESALASTYPNFELIIVDDCSKDKTVSIARRYENIDNRVKVYINKKNLGDYPNRNKAASYANGEYLMYLDSDDKLYKDGVENCVKAALQYPEANFGMYNILDKKGLYKMHATEAVRMHLLKKPFLLIGPGAVFIKKDFFNEINGFPEKYGPANDMYFHLKACNMAGIVLLPFQFIFYRIHDGQEINNRFSYLYNNYRYYRDALKELKLPLSGKELKWLNNKNKRRFIVNAMKFLFKNGNVKKTLEAVKLAEFKFSDIIGGVFH